MNCSRKVFPPVGPIPISAINTGPTMNDIRILLLCSSRFALQTMQELAFFNQLAVVAIPAHCDEWHEHAQVAMTGTNVPVITVTKEHYVTELQAAIKTYQVNLGLMVTFSFKLPASVYTLPEKGFFNVHPAPLPAYRGADPIFHMIKNREQLAGVTIHQVDERFDTGPVVVRELMKIRPADTYGLLSTRLSLTASKLTHTLIKLISFGLPLPLKPQDATQGTYYKRQTAKDVSIDWEVMTAEEIIAQMNACNPWNKGASTRIGTRIMRLLEGRKTEGIAGAFPGTILSFNKQEVVIACIQDDALAVSIISTDEGIFSGHRLQETDILPGLRFERSY